MYALVSIVGDDESTMIRKRVSSKTITTNIDKNNLDVTPSVLNEGLVKVE